ncbi:MAG: tetratricopeptide repeat protein [Pseudomonadota bacterium]
MTKKLITWPMLRTLGLYIGACWVAVEFADWLVGRYNLPDRVVDLTLIGLLSFTPTVALLARNHGEPGHQEWTITDKLAIPINALLSTALIGTLFFGQPFKGADASPLALETRTVTDPTGETMTRPVVTQALSQGITLFFFDNATGDESLDWMQYGANIALYADLIQHPYVKAWSPFVGMEAYGMFQLRKAGFDDGLKVPVALKRTIADKGLMEYFVGGRIEVNAAGDSKELVALLYDTASSRVLAEMRQDIGPEGGRLFAAIDAVTAEMFASLNLPGGEEVFVDLPTSDRLTNSLAAFESHTNGITAQLLDSDRDRAIRLWQQAVQEDPTFAVAHLTMGRALFEGGMMLDGGMAMQTALRHDYKLNDRERFVAKGMNYVFRGDREKELATYETWAELHPNDPMAYIYLGSAHLYGQNDPGNALTSYESAIDLDPRETWLLAKIAYLHELGGNREAAVEYYTRYVEAAPDDPGPLSSLGNLHRREGDLARARAFFERAVIVARGMVDPTLNLAELDLREGRYDAALARLDEASQIAATPRQHAAVLRQRIAYLGQRGQETEVVAKLPDLADQATQFLAPIDVIMGVWVEHVEHYVLAGQVEEAVEMLRKHEAQLQPPLNTLLDVGYLKVAVAMGDPQTAQLHGDAAGELLETLGLDHMRAYVGYYTGRVLSLLGRPDEAITELEKARTAYLASIQRIQDENLEFEIVTRLADVYLEQGRLDDARSNFEFVLTRYPANVEANLGMAKLLQREGDGAAAAPYLAAVNSALAQADTDHPLLLAARTVEASLDI